MADIDEDIPVTSLHAQAANDEDNDPTDDTPDYRLLASLSSKSSFPKRGEKDFEPHGTKHQDGILETSRQAMHDALSHTRFHIPKNYTRGFYYGQKSMGRDDVIPAEARKGLEDDRVVLLETSKGPHWKSMGKTNLGLKQASLWLLPEEALYLVERGNLDLWWPSRSSFKGGFKTEDKEATQDSEHEDDENDEGVPMSVQAAFALLTGNDSEKGRVSLERYTVYTNLKRNGYVVLRAPAWDPTNSRQSQNLQQATKSNAEFPNLFSWLFGRLFPESAIEPPPPFGPLVKPGMYRSYHAIYRQIAIIPRYKPSPKGCSPPPEDPYRVVYHLWTPDNASTFVKKNPGEPDFRVAVTDARSTSIPSLAQMTALLESTPWDPPSPKLVGPSKLYQRLKHGARSVVLAVVDQGVISYLRLGETAFGEENLVERFDGGQTGGNKRSGGAGRGRGGHGRGRGRGRGRGS